MAYHMEILKKPEDKITYLPFTWHLKDGRRVRLMSYDEKKHEFQIYTIFKLILEEGDTYPQENVDSIEDFRKYFVTHNVFVCVLGDTDDVIGAFYIKPNFPHRSAHICNAGFIVDSRARGCGLGRFMAQAFLFLARDLQYKASFFNLVYETNVSAVHLYRSLGFVETGRIPKAGKLKGHEDYVGAIQFYYDLTALESDFRTHFDKS